MASIDHYAVLDLKPDATAEEIKKAYRAMAFKTHPDRGGVTHLFRMVQESYETLSDPDKRAAYDREIGAAPAAQDEPQPFYEDDEPAQAYQDVAEPEAEPARRLPKAALIAWIVVLAGLAGWWLFQEYQLWTLVQAKNQFRMYTAQGVPAIVYAVLWAFSTLVSAFADDVFHATKIVAVCTTLAGVFAFVTATGAPGQWFLALGTGLALTLAIAIAVRTAAARR